MNDPVFYPYGLCVACAAALGLILMQYTGKRQGVSMRGLSWFAVLALPLAFLFARIGYCLVCFQWWMGQGWGFFFQFTRGGYLLYGAMIGTVLAGWLTHKITKDSTAKILSSAAAPGALVICISRMGESLVELGYGHNILDWFDPWMEKGMIACEDPSFFYRFPFGVQDFYGDWNFAIFLPEALVALTICLMLLFMKKRADGASAALLVLVYASCQLVLESMRMDAVLRWGFVKVNQMLSAAAVAVVLMICMHRAPKGRYRLLSWAGVIAEFGVVMAMEFALEQKISFLTWMRMDICYLVMILACLGLIFTVLPWWRKAFPKA